jgi:hypothetical protein
MPVLVLNGALRMAGLSSALCVAMVGCGGNGPALDATPQAITFEAPPALLLGQQATVSASASSGLPVSYTSQSPAVCAVAADTGVVTGLALGDCVIAADQAGDSHYAPAATATQALVVQSAGRAQTISFAAAPTLTQYGLATVSATSDAGLAVTYASTTPAVCIVDVRSGLVTDLAVGDCVIAAQQAGNDDYDAAEPVALTLPVAARVGDPAPPGAPSGVAARLGSDGNTVIVSYTGLADSGGNPVTGFTAQSVPAGLSASVASGPITIACGGSCSGRSFQVVASNTLGAGAASSAAEVVTVLNVTARFYEPDTQPNDSIFTGSLSFNSTTGTASGLAGKLTESMTGSASTPMTEIALAHQLTSINDGTGGLIVSTFALPTTDVFSPSGFADTLNGIYFGYPATYNEATANSFVSVYLNLANPVATPTPAQVNLLVYGDCAPGGMMGAACMTGMVNGGTMGGYPVAQTITVRAP